MSKYNDRDIARFDAISSQLLAYTPRLLQDLLTLLGHIQTSEISLSAFKAWMIYQKTEGGFEYNYAKKSDAENGYRCPICGDELHLMNVNDSNCNQVGEGLQSLFFCPEQECGYEMWSDRKVSYWLKLLNSIGRDNAETAVIKKSTCGGCGSK